MDPKLKAVFLASRIKTLPLAISSIFIGTGLAINNFDFFIFIFICVTATLLQILANFANDYGDGVAGTDTKERKGPTRALAAGLLTAKEFKKLIIYTILLTSICGLFLVYYALLDKPYLLSFFILLGALSIAAAIFYTMGKKPYGYVGLGDIICFIFFGPVAVLGTAALYSYNLNALDILPAISTGILPVLVLNINNIRDIATDTKANKQTFALILGETKAKRYQLVILLMACAYWFIYFMFIKNIIFALVSLILFSPLFLHIKRLFKQDVQYNLELQKVSITSGLINLALTLLLII